MMLTARFWGSTEVLLCALLLQNCQPNSVATEGERPAASTSSASTMRPCAFSEPPAVPPSAPLNALPAAHTSSSHLSTTLDNEEAPSMRTTMSSSPTALCGLQAAPVPRASHVVPLGGEYGQASSPDGPGVCVNKAKRVSREVLGDVKEDAKPPTKRRYSGSEKDLANKRVRAGEGAVPDKAKEGDKNGHLLALRTLGEMEWKHYFGEVGQVPDLPSRMATILDSACPFWPEKKVKDTHLLVLIPAKVDGQLLSLNLLRDLIERPKNGGHRTRYRDYNSDVEAQIGAVSPAASYWLLMTRDVLPESRCKSYGDQEKLVAAHARRTGLPYELPRALEAATAILMHHVRNGEQLYSNTPWTYTSCRESIFTGEYGACFPVVGGFESSGLRVTYGFYGSCFNGVAGCRKFLVEEGSKPLATAFGAKEWQQYYGEVGAAPPLPADIDAILDSLCPFGNGEKVRDTHLLVLIPAAVDGALFTLNLLAELIEHPKNGGHRTRYRDYNSDVEAQIGAVSPAASYWLLMTRSVLPESRCKSYGDQAKLMAAHARRTGLPYELPKALEAATVILTHHVQNGERLYSDSSYAYTRCQESVFIEELAEFPVVVGRFESAGLGICHDFFGHLRGGVAGCRKFCVEADSKPPARQRSTNLAPKADLANKSVHAEERAESDEDKEGDEDVLLLSLKALGEVERKHCREQREQGGDPPAILLNVASLKLDKAIQFLNFLLVATQDNHCRQQALGVLNKMAKAPPDVFSECLSSLRAMAKAGDEGIRLLALRTLGEMEWRRYFGEVGQAPDLPSSMATILDSACPFWPEKQVKDTHLLVLIPAKVDDQPFSLNLLCDLIERPKNGGHKTKCCYYNAGSLQAQIGTASPAASYWLLMTRDVLPESCNKTYADHKKLVAEHASRTSLPYELPKALEAATAILTHHVRDGERLYGDSPRTYTRCQEWVLREFKEYPAFVGGFGSSGLDVSSGSYDGSTVRGVAGCRKSF
jgi:hypothetical protein